MGLWVVDPGCLMLACRCWLVGERKLGSRVELVGGHLEVVQEGVEEEQV